MFVYLSEIREYYKFDKEPRRTDYSGLFAGEEGEAMYKKAIYRFNEIPDNEKYKFSEFLTYVRNFHVGLKQLYPICIIHKERIVKTIE